MTLLRLEQLPLQLRGLRLGLRRLVQIGFQLTAQILRRLLSLQQLVRQIHRRQHGGVNAAHMGALLQLRHLLIHQSTYLLHVGGALISDQGVILAADAHCDTIRHSDLLLSM